MMNNTLPDKPVHPRANTIVVEDRRKVTLTGVNDVASFHDQEVVLKSDDGEIIIVGEQLHISNLSLDDGRLVVEGVIGGLEYNDAPISKQSGIFRRMFR